MSRYALDVAALARRMLALRQQRATLPSLLAEHPDLSVTAAYAVAEAIARQRCEAGERIVGRKIGLTNRAAWPALQAEAPLWGYVYDSSLVEAGDGNATVGIGQAVAPRIEAEIGFGLRGPVDPGETQLEVMCDAIDWVAPCFEIIDSHHAQWRFKAAEAIADFGVHHRLVVGPRMVMPAAGARAALTAALADCRVELLLDGQVVETGRGANTLDHPLLALQALVRLLAQQVGSIPLRAGDVITTGTLTNPRDVVAGQNWQMRFEGLALQPLGIVLAG